MDIVETTTKVEVARENLDRISEIDGCTVCRAFGSYQINVDGHSSPATPGDYIVTDEAGNPSIKWETFEHH